MPKIINKTIPLLKVISGGQTGADRAGLFAARELGLQTGGYISQGYRSLDESGSWPEAKEFGLEELNSPLYPPRTAMNVKSSDGTVRFAKDWYSPGEKLTMKMIVQYKKPYFELGMRKYNKNLLETEYTAFRFWLRAHRIETLNVAGNSEQTAPGIYEFTYAFLIGALKGYV